MRLLIFAMLCMVLLNACGTAIGSFNAQPTLPTLPTVTVEGGLVTVPTVAAAQPNATTTELTTEFADIDIHAARFFATEPR